MIHNFLDKCKDIFIDSINKLKGSDRRIALAKVSKAIGKGGQRVVAKKFKISRDTTRKGVHYKINCIGSKKSTCKNEGL
jgi:hypothetical protein